MIATVIFAEWRAMLRNRAALTAALLLLALTLGASLASYEHMHAVARDRAQFQQTADTQWNQQPDRHPHRVVHAGHYVFKPLSPLAFFDFGVDPYTGHTLFLEGHRQNSANFSEAGQSSVLLRFGQLTPAFVLQVLTPLLIIFLAFGSVAREREQGQLRLMMAQGTRALPLVAGKCAAHGAVGLLFALPAFAALGLIGASDAQYAPQAAWMIAGYAAYSLFWSVLAVLVSAVSARARDALLILVGIWIATAVVIPRAAAEAAARGIERPTRIETESALAQQLSKLGDSHNPGDPYFAAFRARVLRQFKVERVEDLPVNYGALVIEEGERMSSALFEEAMLRDAARQQRQGALMDGAAIASPLIALRRLSTTLAGTDGGSHTRFLLEAERYRYNLIQALNRLHAEKIGRHNDKDQRLDSSHWQRMPRFAHRADGLDAQMARGVKPALPIALGWALLLGAAGLLVARKLERNPV